MKNIALILLLVTALLMTGGCEKDPILDYEAYVTIVNIGNVAMNAAVEGDWVRIPSYESATWAVLLDSEFEVVDVLAEAKPVIGNDHDSETLRLQGDRDVVTWLAGWDSATSSSQVLRKPSRVLRGQHNVKSLIQKYR